MEGRKEESGKGIGLGGLGTAVNGARRRRCHHPTADSGGQGRGEAPPTLPSKRARPGQQASPWRPSALSTRPPVAVRGAAALCKWGKTKTVSVGASPSPPPHASHPPWPPVPSVPPSAASRPPSSLGLDSPGSTCTPNPPSPPPVGITVKAEEEGKVAGVAKCRHRQRGHPRTAPRRPEVGGHHWRRQRKGHHKLDNLGARDEAPEGEAVAQNLSGGKGGVGKRESEEGQGKGGEHGGKERGGRMGARGGGRAGGEGDRSRDRRKEKRGGKDVGGEGREGRGTARE